MTDASKEALHLIIEALTTGNLGDLVARALKAEAEKCSVEIGGAGDRLKFYFDAHDLEGAKRLIDNAMDARAYAIGKMQGAK